MSDSQQIDVWAVWGGTKKRKCIFGSMFEATNRAKRLLFLREAVRQFNERDAHVHCGVEF